MYPVEDPVFRQKEVLFSDYIPDHLPHHEKEIKAISSLINSALKNPASISNIFIYGPPSTGKTASIKFIFRRLEEETAALPVYINCFRVNTRMGVVYDKLEESGYEEILRWVFLMFSLLSCRLKQLEGDIIRENPSRLYIKNLLSPAMLNMDLVSFGKDLINTMIDTHLMVSMLRWSEQNTQNWIFTEGDGVIQYARLTPFEARPRDNR